MWYIAITLFLYIITPPIYSVIKKLWKVAWLFLIAIILSFIGISVAIKTNFPAYWEETSIGIARIPYYFMGMLLAYFTQKNIDNKKIYGFLLAILLLYIVFYFLGYSEANFHMGAVMLTIGIAVLSVIFCMCAKNSLSNSIINGFMKWMGKYSYELYMLHLYLWFIIRNTLHLGQWYNIALACGLAIILAYPVHIVVDWICNKVQNVLLK